MGTKPKKEDADAAIWHVTARGPYTPPDQPEIINEKPLKLRAAKALAELTSTHSKQLVVTLATTQQLKGGQDG